MFMNRLFKISAKFFSTSSANNLKFIQFTYKCDKNNVRVGYFKDACNVVDLNMIDCSIPNTMLEVLRCQQLPKIFRLQHTDLPTVPFCSIDLEVPIHNVDKIIGVGHNYYDQCEQKKIPIPEVPMFFSKFPSTLTGPDRPILLRSIAERVDWEIELCVVIGCIASNVPESHAYEVIMGCTIAQDITARDWAGPPNGGQVTLAKNMDTFCPLGPWIVSKDELCDMGDLILKTSINGVCKQYSTTRNMIHKIPKLINRLTSVTTLYPGDLILTGTPGGTGELSIPVQYLQPGDHVCSEIQCIGALNNCVCVLKF